MAVIIFAFKNNSYYDDDEALINTENINNFVQIKYELLFIAYPRGSCGKFFTEYAYGVKCGYKCVKFVTQKKTLWLTYGLHDLSSINANQLLTRFELNHIINAECLMTMWWIKLFLY